MELNQYKQGDYHPGASLVKQLLWYFLGNFLVQTPLLPIPLLKVAILRLFGAKIGTGVNIKPHVKIKFPWRLTVGNYVWLGEKCWIDNLAAVSIESHVCISQGVYLCTGNHDWGKPSFDLITRPIHIATGCWIGANATIGPGVRVNEGAVLTLGSVAVQSLAAMTIYSGNPCQPVKKRKLT
ncbi:colanic acid biosynthesis acetyltransferase WcaF [Synechocystis sp. FACHB-383]|uniref:WcaF family extracellular polysaccharide biosynthesis acetyltransferase n=1 Tax=Synechocystis sp. FACHB-383 TaxID=2692864 RepID=UPI001683D053|nr:WcaF family extracellular polysaccharide biosynthesis acetyltransferase [Synechocystis sp. FACHB-383]MBD2654431.1 colanic acid biosynthesis acetyltransferase WcaF [Synechocystis sp. FACHB-383]